MRGKQMRFGQLLIGALKALLLKAFALQSAHGVQALQVFVRDAAKVIGQLLHFAVFGHGDPHTDKQQKRHSQNAECGDQQAALLPLQSDLHNSPHHKDRSPDKHL